MEAQTQASPAQRLRAKRDQQRNALADQWRALGRAATVVAILTSPVFFVILHERNGWRTLDALVVTFIAVIAFRGLVDVLTRRWIPSPNLYGAEQKLAEEDVVAKRRLWYWRTKFRRLVWLTAVLGSIVFAIFFVQYVSGSAVSLGDALGGMGEWVATLGPMLLVLGLQLPMLFLINILILFGPLLFFGIKQIKGYEPGDADWGVKLEDVRGQAEAKEDVGRVIALWQSGEEFEEAGGKRERGLLFLGAPGTGKTMLAKAIATNFNSPFVTIPGSGFAQTFIGLDAIIVRYLVRKAKKLARKWGGQCIIFIDEIDAVGMRRQSLGGAMGNQPRSIHDLAFYGPMGSIHPDGELLLETYAWRERIFHERAAAESAPRLPSIGERIRNFMIPGMGGGGGMALNQLLIVMDGVDDPPFMRRFFTNRINTFLDAIYIVPQKIGRSALRLPRPKPSREQVFFIGATNVPINRLDPALIRPGRMGRHIWFRTPTKEDRKDIFELYITKVDHEPELDSPKRRDEMARITHGYSPAMIEQVCSMALTYSHSDGRFVFNWQDLVEAMTTVESGTALGIQYLPEDTKAVAVHEAGHAVASYVYMQDLLSTRLSIRARGSSLGHHSAAEKEERFSHWRHREFGELVWILGAMAAEHVFYNENTTGVSGDVQSATTTAAMMAGVWAMGPEPVEFDGRLKGPVRIAREQERVMQRFEELGLRIMNRMSMGGIMEGDPVSAVLNDRDKRKTAAQLLGQAYFAAYHTMDQNRQAVEKVANVLVERKEMHGDEVVDLLESVDIKRPTVDYIDEGLMAEDLTLPDGEPEAEDGAPPPYQSRFQLVLGVLLGIGMAAVAATAIFVASGNPKERRIPWSEWKPTAKDGEAALQQIARHVGLRYSFPDGNQLVGVRGGNLSLQGLPLTVALTSDPQAGGDGSIKYFDEGALYQLCGLGKNCAIKKGKPSTKRLLLLGRESLELALYTFRYTENVGVVVVMLPPAPGERPSRAMFFRRDDLEASVQNPIHATLPGPPPQLNKFRPGEASRLERLTAPNLFSYKIQQGQDARLMLVLERPQADTP